MGCMTGFCSGGKYDWPVPPQLEKTASWALIQSASSALCGPQVLARLSSVAMAVRKASAWQFSYSPARKKPARYTTLNCLTGWTSGCGGA